MSPVSVASFQVSSLTFVFFVFCHTAVVGVTLCCPPVWWATPPYWELWLPWCTTATASSIVLETTGKRNVHVLRN